MKYFSRIGGLLGVLALTPLAQGFLGSLGLKMGHALYLVLLAGGMSGPGTADGTGSAARFDHPSGIASDSAGNVFVADSASNTIRKVTPAGVVTTWVGTAGTTGYVNGTGAAARFSNLTALAVDSSDNVYVADTFNNAIRKVTPAGVVTTLAGSGTVGSNNGTGAAASFYAPNGIAVDSSGNVYVADSANNMIRKITSAGVVTTLAGSTTAGTTDGTGTAARFNNPSGVGVDSSGNVYVADTNNDTIRKITSAGVVTTFAGTAGSLGTTDATGTAARFGGVTGIVVDTSGNLFVSDSTNQTIRKITSAGVVTTFAGSVGSAGSVNGTGTAAKFGDPIGLGIDSSNNIYVDDFGNNEVRKITSTAVVTTLAGSTSSSADGTGAAAFFAYPLGISVGSGGTVYIAEFGGQVIRKITSSGVVTTFAGTAGLSGSTNATGSAARFAGPAGIVVDGSGNLFVVDQNNCEIREVTSGAVVTTFAGSTSCGSTNATGTAAGFGFPRGIAEDSSGNFYIADYGNNTIRKITSAGVVTTLAGTAGLSGSTDATGAAARFNGPAGVAVDASGNVYVADEGNSTIRKITSAGVVTTIAGSAGVTGSVDGVGTAAQFNSPEGIAVSSAGMIYVADSANGTIRKINASGKVTTVVGATTQADIVLGPLPAGLYTPSAVAVTNGMLYIIAGNSILRCPEPH